MTRGSCCRNRRFLVLFPNLTRFGSPIGYPTCQTGTSRPSCFVLFGGLRRRDEERRRMIHASGNGLSKSLMIRLSCPAIALRIRCVRPIYRQECDVEKPTLFSRFGLPSGCTRSFANQCSQLVSRNFPRSHASPATADFDRRVFDWFGR